MSLLLQQKKIYVLFVCLGRPLLEKIPKSLTNITSTIFPAQVRGIRVDIGLHAITTLLALMGCGFDVMADGKLKALQITLK